MRCLTALIMMTISTHYQVLARSSLLEGVKKNPEEATTLCKKFKSMNSKGISVTSDESIKEISEKRNLSLVDAEILTMYVIGLNCPNVR